MIILGFVSSKYLNAIDSFERIAIAEERQATALESMAQSLDDYMESTGHKIVRENKKSKGENNEN